MTSGKTNRRRVTAALGLRDRLFLGFLVCVGLIAGVGGFGWHALDRTVELSRTFSDFASPLLHESGEVANNLTRAELVVARALRDTDANNRAAAEIDALADATTSHLARMAELSVAFGRRIDIEEAGHLVRDFFASARSTLATRAASNDKAETAQRLHQDFEWSALGMNRRIRRFVQSLEAEINELEDGTRTTIQAGDASIDHLGAVIETIFYEMFQSLQNANGTLEHLSEIDATVAAYVAEGEIERLGRLDQKLGTALHGMEARMHRLAARARGDARASAEIDTMVRDVATLRVVTLGPHGLIAAHRAFVEANLAARREEAVLGAIGERLTPLLRTLQTSALSLNDENKARLTAGSVSSSITILAVVLLASLAAIVFSIVSANSLTRPLFDLMEVMNRLVGGDYRVDVPVHRGPREIAGMANAVSVFKEHIRQRLRAEAALALAKQTAEAASRAKSDFLSNMSHEIRTPMNAIIGFFYLLEQTELRPIQKDYVGKARMSAQSLLAILNDILDFSKIEAGRMDLTEEPFRLDDLMKALAAMAAVNARGKDIEVLFRIAPDTPLSLVGDALRLQQVLTNLAGNAIKFTEQGEVVLSVEPLEIGADRTLLSFVVRDTGIGIPREHQDIIFDAFSQAETTTSRRFGGTGLGLAICRRLVELMGGEISVESEPGRGSAFRITVPFACPAAVPDAPEPMSCVPRDIKVLVADDNPVAREVIAAMIAPFGWTVEVAGSGRDALAAIRAASQGRRFDLLLLDWRMPEIGGREIVRHLKDHCPPAEVPIILVVTAFEYEQVRRESEGDTLIRDILTKPVTPSILLDAVAAVCSEQNPPPPPAPAMVGAGDAGGEPLAGLSLLLVEDNTINQIVACRILESAGARVTVANGGIEAIDCLTADPTAVDAVLMDIQMPGMDGYDATRVIRDDLGLRDLPIIAMTANAMASDRERCLAAGMNDHIGKPFDVAAMLRMVARYANDHRRSHPASTRAADFAEIDVDEALATTAGDGALLQRLMGLFADTYAPLVESLPRLLADGDLASVTVKAHDLKGVAGNLGATTLSAAAERLLGAARAGDHDEAQASAREVCRLLAVVVDSARRFAAREPALS